MGLSIGGVGIGVHASAIAATGNHGSGIAGWEFADREADTSCDGLGIVAKERREAAFADGFNESWLWVAPSSQTRIEKALRELLDLNR